MPFHRVLSNSITSALVSARTGIRIRDSQTGFRLIGREGSVQRSLFSRWI